MIKVLDIYQMIPEHNTDEVSLLFVGSYLCKLTFPIIYNFLNMCGIADPKQGTDYSSRTTFIQYLGPAVNLTPLFGSKYNDWVPFLIFVISLIVAFNLHGRIARLFSKGSYFYESQAACGNEEGRDLIITSRVFELRRLKQSDEEISTNYKPKSRNTADLLAKYQNRTHTTRDEVVDLNIGTSEKSRQKNGYSSIGANDNMAQTSTYTSSAKKSLFSYFKK